MRPIKQLDVEVLQRVIVELSAALSEITQPLVVGYGADVRPDDLRHLCTLVSSIHYALDGDHRALGTCGCPCMLAKAEVALAKAVYR